MRPIAIVVLLALALTAPVNGQVFDLDWYTIDGGGATLTVGGVFELSGTIGQFDAAEPMLGGVFTMIGGFWPVTTAHPALPGDLDGDCDVDLADLTQCLSNFGCLPPSSCPADIDGDGDTDLSDLTSLLSNFGSACP